MYQKPMIIKLIPANVQQIIVPSCPPLPRKNKQLSYEVKS